MLQASTLTFLKNLKKNNNRPWFEKNKSVYLTAKEDIEHFTERLIEGFGKTDVDIAPLQIKDCTFRIYRDVRFSKDKRPYKANMGAYLNKGGKKMPTAGYYFHCEPGGNFIAGGMWMPMAPELSKVRQEIDYNFAEWTKILGNRAFKKMFSGGLDQADILSRPPKGYEAENPAIDYLKLKSFVVRHPLTDQQMVSRTLLKEVITAFDVIHDYVHFLNRSIE
jgi:uncharacterized protein (TIGR02453 family)